MLMAETMEKSFNGFRRSAQTELVVIVLEDVAVVIREAMDWAWQWKKYVTMVILGGV